ncbi:MAG: metallopeptidase family protein [Propionibacterium sp.]|nr:metallopeptidase family protein [Propionibacterium sp.]
MDAARPPAIDITDDDFDALVEEAFDELPDELLEHIDNLIFVIEDEPEDGSDTLGVYEGTALTERDEYGFGQLPDRIVLFKGPLTRLARDLEELYDEIIVTLVHELGHYHGIEEARLHELGWG